MAITTTEPVTWEGSTYHEALELGFSESTKGRETFVVSLYTTPAPEPRGTYFTVIPISHADYRREHPTRASYEDKGRELIVYCDWGRGHSIKASRDTLDKLVAECESYEVPRRAATPE